MGRRGNILLITLVAVGVLAASVGGYLWWQKRCGAWPFLDKNVKCELGQRIDGSVAQNPPDQTEGDKTVNWKTIKKSITYGGDFVAFEIKAPADFSEGQSGGLGLGLQNPSGSIVIGFSYASQGSLTGNASAGEYQPVKNLSVVIQGKQYSPEEYYDTLTKYYVFDILSILDKGTDRQIRATGRYKNEADKTIVSQILSTFKFIDQDSTQNSSEVKLLSTIGWTRVENSTFSIRYPSDKFRVGKNEDYIQLIPLENIDLDRSKSPDFVIIKGYNGQSRRQWYLNYYSYNPAEVNFNDRMAGMVSFLEVIPKTRKTPDNLLLTDGAKTLINVSVQGADLKLVETVISTTVFK